MQELAIIDDLKQKKDKDVQSELLDPKEDMRKRRDEMRSHLHIRREIHVSETTLKMIKKRQEKVRNLVYKGKKDATDGDIRSKMKDIRDITSLTSITLKVSKSMTDEGMGSIGNALRHLTSLKSVSIDLSMCDSITDKGMISIGDSLRHLTSLTSIIFKFASRDSITDKGIKSIGDSLQYQSSLKSLTLDFSSRKAIPVAGMRSIGESLRHLTSLKSLILNCQEISFLQ